MIFDISIESIKKTNIRDGEIKKYFTVTLT